MVSAVGTAGLLRPDASLTYGFQLHSFILFRLVHGQGDHLSINLSYHLSSCNFLINNVLSPVADRLTLFCAFLKSHVLFTSVRYI